MAYAYKIHDQQGLYFITCTVHQWVDVFTRKDYADIVVQSLRFCQENKGLEIYAWVIMSNHIRLIISCREGFNLSDVLRDFKKYTATQVVEFIFENNLESRRSWLMWLFKPQLVLVCNEDPLTWRLQRRNHGLAWFQNNKTILF